MDDLRAADEFREAVRRLRGYEPQRFRPKVHRARLAAGLEIERLVDRVKKRTIVAVAPSRQLPDFFESARLRRSLRGARVVSAPGGKRTLVWPDGSMVVFCPQEVFLVDVEHGRLDTAPWPADAFVLLGMPIEYEETIRRLWPLAEVASFGDDPSTDVKE